MGYNIEDENGDVGTGPTISGLRDLKAFFKTQPAEDFIALEEFLEKGWTSYTKLLSAECEVLAELSKQMDKNLATSFKALAKSAKKAKGIVMLTS